MMISAETTDSGVTISWSFQAAPELVWQALTSPPLLRQWLGDVTDGGISEGATFTVAHGPAESCLSAVTTFKPGRHLAYSWEFTGESQSAVDWHFHTKDNGTTLTLTHTGLAELAYEYHAGWITHLLYLEASILGTPLPWELFNSIHSAMVNGQQ